MLFALFSANFQTNGERRGQKMFTQIEISNGMKTHIKIKHEMILRGPFIVAVDFLSEKKTLSIWCVCRPRVDFIFNFGLCILIVPFHWAFEPTLHATHSKSIRCNGFWPKTFRSFGWMGQTVTSTVANLHSTKLQRNCSYLSHERNQMAKATTSNSTKSSHPISNTHNIAQPK